MQTNWMPICLVPRKEAARFAANPPPGYKLVSFHTDMDRLNFADCQDGDEEVEVETVFRDAVVCCHITKGGQTEQLRLASLWTEQFGAEPPAQIEINDSGDQLDLAPYLLPLLAQSWRDSAARTTGLMRELALLRGTFEQAQTAFARLESFLYQSGRAERSQIISLPHLPGRNLVLLSKDSPVEQRLPIESASLSDIAFLIIELPRCAGTLNARLELQESATVVAQWAISESDLAKGWVRLSLSRALGTDAQTPVLSLDWNGQEPVKLAPSFHHPDIRFRATDSSAVLALNLWTYIPGAAAPLPAEGVAQLSDAPAVRWSIGASSLRDAINLNLRDDLVEFTDWRKSLAVRPVSPKPSAVRLDNVARPGLLYLRGGVKTEGEFGPNVEYCYAIAPKAKRLTQRGTLPEFSAGMTSEWLRLRPNEWADLTLFLAKPLEEVCDLYLLSRLVDDAPPEEPVNACFFGIVGQAWSVGS